MNMWDKGHVGWRRHPWTWHQGPSSHHWLCFFLGHAGWWWNSWISYAFGSFTAEDVGPLMLLTWASFVSSSNGPVIGSRAKPSSDQAGKPFFFPPICRLQWELTYVRDASLFVVWLGLWSMFLVGFLGFFLSEKGPDVPNSDIWFGHNVDMACLPDLRKVATWRCRTLCWDFVVTPMV